MDLGQESIHAIKTEFNQRATGPAFRRIRKPIRTPQAPFVWKSLASPALGCPNALALRCLPCATSASRSAPRTPRALEVFRWCSEVQRDLQALQEIDEQLGAALQSPLEPSVAGTTTPWVAGMLENPPGALPSSSCKLKHEGHLPSSRRRAFTSRMPISRLGEPVGGKERR